MNSLEQIDAKTALIKDLLQPPATATLDLLLSLWRQEIYEIVCDRPKGLEDHLDLPVRIRGALGRELLANSQQRTSRADPFNRPSAFEILFGDMNDAASVRPYVLDADVNGMEVCVRLAVFGSAMFWARAGRDALLRALFHGIAIREGGRQKVSLVPRSVARSRLDGIDIPQNGTRFDVTIILRSPLVIRHGSSLSITANALASSVLNKARAMARWQGFQLTEEGEDLCSIKDFVLDSSDTIPFFLKRFSRRQKGRTIRHNSVTGKIHLQGISSSLLKLLLIAEQVHLGSHAGLGLGRIELAIYARK